MTPKQFFESRYGSAARTVAAFASERDDSHLVPSDMVAATSQDYCDQLADHCKTLLRQDEGDLLGDFFFGLTSELLLSSSIEPIGSSYLVLLHRRLFNALEFLGDILASMTITDVDRWRIMASYFNKVAVAPKDLTSFPSAPSLCLKEEVIGGALLKNALVRFVLCHELAHVLRTPDDVNLNDFPSISALPENWQEEVRCDLVGLCLPLREARLEGYTAEAYRAVSLSAPLVFIRFLGMIEQVNTTKSDHHPPASARAWFIERYLLAKFSDRNSLIENMVRQTEFNFRMIEQYRGRI